MDATLPAVTSAVLLRLKGLKAERQFKNVDFAEQRRILERQQREVRELDAEIAFLEQWLQAHQMNEAVS